jgi:2-oxoglutarate ferredoxin oxidoreductase subunit beta
MSHSRSGPDIAWCPGCGNFGILSAVQQALSELRLQPSQVVLVSGIGQAAKLAQYVSANVFDGLHGRALPAAAGVKLANPALTVIAIGGDGDFYSEGTGHLIHALRRNVTLTCLVHNNQVYGLTRGQYSATSEPGFRSSTSVEGSVLPPLNPLALGIALDGALVARGFAGDVDGLARIIQQAIATPGLSLVDILQPCVTFNRVNTFAWYKERVYYLDDTHDPTDPDRSMARALEWPAPRASDVPRIPLGVFYHGSRPTLEHQLPQLAAAPLVQQTPSRAGLRELIERFR